jgi:hypothetical protein
MGALGHFLVLVVIGGGMGFALTRYGHGVRVTGTVASGDATSALVGIAGSFMGYHIGLILGFYYELVLYVAAAGIAAVTVLAWRGR